MERFILLVMVFISCVASVLADEAPTGPELGNTNIAVSGEGITSASIGENTTASQEVGSIDSGDIDNIGIEVEATGDTDAAIGEGSCSEQKIGSVGSQNDC